MFISESGARHVHFATHVFGVVWSFDCASLKMEEKYKMDFGLSKKHEMARSLFKEFAENEVKPLAQEVDETEKFPTGTVEKMAKYGFLGIPVPKELGGQGCDILTYAMCVEELSKVCGTTGVIVSAHTSLCVDPILTFGTPEQKEKYVPDLASGKKLGAFGLTEPMAGTDAQGQQTKAVLDGDEWVLNGSKCFITNGKEADVYIVIAVTGKVEKRGRTMKEISAFIVEKGTPGFTFGVKEKKMGIRGSSTYELIFTDCRIPKENLLGKQGKGFNIAMHTLDGGRIGIAAQALGLAEGALETTIAYVKERKQFGRSIAQFQNTQFQLADMATKVKAAQLMVYRAALKKDEYQAGAKVSYSVEAAMAKLYAAEVAMEVTTKCVQLHGGYGYIREYDVERMMRDAKITEIYEGTSEVQRMVISGALLK
jgi:butyryl-CoA dehydrogenase